MDSQSTKFSNVDYPQNYPQVSEAVNSQRNEISSQNENKELSMIQRGIMNYRPAVSSILVLWVLWVGAAGAGTSPFFDISILKNLINYGRADLSNAGFLGISIFWGADRDELPQEGAISQFISDGGYNSIIYEFNEDDKLVGLVIRTSYHSSLQYLQGGKYTTTTWESRGKQTGLGTLTLKARFPHKTVARQVVSKPKAAKQDQPPSLSSLLQKGRFCGLELNSRFDSNTSQFEFENKIGDVYIYYRNNEILDFDGISLDAIHYAEFNEQLVGISLIVTDLSEAPKVGEVIKTLLGNPTGSTAGRLEWKTQKTLVSVQRDDAELRIVITPI